MEMAVDRLRRIPGNHPAQFLLGGGLDVFDGFEFLQQGMFPLLPHPGDAVQSGAADAFVSQLPLIGDGKAVGLLLNLPHQSEDRRGIFEEAAGIVKYRVRVAESEKRLAAAEENLEKIEETVSQLESRLEPLRQASETARRFLSMRDELRGLECAQFIRISDENTGKIKTLRERLETYQSQTESEEARIGICLSAREEENARLSEFEQEVARLRSAFVGMTRQTEALRGSLALLRSEMTAAEKETAELGETNEKAARRLEEIQGDEEENRQLLTREEEALSRLEDRVNEQREAVSACQALLEKTEEAYERNQSDVILAMNRRTDRKSQEARLSALRQQLSQRLSAAEEDARRLFGNTEGIEEQIGECDRAADGLLKRKQEVVENRARLEAAIQKTTGEIENLYRELDTARAERSGQASRLRVLEDMVRDYAGYQQSVKKVLQKAKGDPRIRGIVAELIHVPKELEKAIEAVLGGALQHIVTADEYAARDMIDYLRENRLGRATFLPMTSVRGKTLQPGERSILSHPGCVGIASECIRFDEAYRGIAENLLGRTLVAENLDAGIEIMRRSRYSFRLVTLEGDVMHAGGSMTGGSAASRMTSLLSRDREIREHKESLRTLDARTEEIQRQIEASRQKKIRDGEALSLENRTLEELRIDESVVKERIAQLRRQMEEENGRIAKNQELLSQIRDMLLDVDQQFERLQAEQHSDPVSDEALQRQGEELSGALLKQRAELEEGQNRLHELELQKVTAQKDAEGVRQKLERLKEERLSLSDERTRREERIHTLILSHQQKRIETENAARDLQAREADEKEAEIGLSRKEKEREKISKSISGLTEEIETGRQRVSALSDEIHRAEMQLSRAENEIAQQEKRIWEEYELTYALAKGYEKAGFDPAKDVPRIQEIRRALKDIGTVNFTATEEYNACRDRYRELTAQREDLENAKRDLEGIIRSLKKEMEVRFLANFSLLQTYLQDAFSRLFGGGKAELRLTDEGDVLGSGIEIAAQPPGKRLQLLSLLSGGERALTAIAILFAMLRLKPTPFCFLDEIEAALDDGNIETFARYLKDFSKDTQFVIVTHRKGTMEHCDSLYGISMEEKGVSKLLSVELKDIEEPEL